MADLSLRAMTTAEFDEWWLSIARAYAAEQVGIGNWSPDEAFESAVRDNTALLPDGLATQGMLLLKAVGDDGNSVGVLWIGLTHPRGMPDCAFLYDIEVEEAYRGAGHGRALLAAAEDVVREHGVNNLELNVFSANTRAFRLYETAGYQAVAYRMRKSLLP